MPSGCRSWIWMWTTMAACAVAMSSVSVAYKNHNPPPETSSPLVMRGQKHIFPEANETMEMPPAFMDPGASGEDDVAQDDFSIWRLQLGAYLNTDVGSVANVMGGRRTSLVGVSVFALTSLIFVFALDLVGHSLKHHVVGDPEAMARMESVIDGSAAFVALMMCFLWHGVLQEFIVTQRYATGVFPSVPSLVLISRLFGMVLAGIVMLWRKEVLDSVAIRSTMLVSVCAAIASIGEQLALQYIMFPVAAVFRALKVLPTMMISTWMNGVVYGCADYVLATCISIFVAGFCVSSVTENDAPHPSLAMGLLLMSMVVLLWAYITNAQKAIFAHFPEFSNIQMMFIMCSFEVLVCYIVVIGDTGVGPVIDFIQMNPQCIPDVTALAVSSALGVYFVVFIINCHGPVVFTVMMACRQVLSIILSSRLFGHSLSKLSWFFAIMTFIFVAYKPLATLLWDPISQNQCTSNNNDTNPIVHAFVMLLARVRGLHGQLRPGSEVGEKSPLLDQRRQEQLPSLTR
eukprot:TRINITY_DN38251_c0_g1_i1.p1 TRINITY_DN38251_c0_g1~~TRINITY_DN38251_c0_g1_i1.p1  ORF type:complete len:515 (+),score=59.10 TRINITY_DN38251_c0_g1_i1:123-1667(+)